MTHSHKRTEWYKEGFFSLITGVLYGATNTIVGHPFDTIKTKMQVQQEYLTRNTGYIDTVKQLYKSQGPIGFYRGCVPPFFGSIIYRSLQFSVYELFYTKWEKSHTLTQPLPMTGGLQPRVILSGMLSSAARSIVECPFEYAKVKRQTGQTYQLNHAYQGFGVLYLRTTGLMTTYFILIDNFRRHTNAFNSKVGQFLASGGSAMFGFWVVWPFENIKNQIQAQNDDSKMNMMARGRDIIKRNGIKGLYRGIIPGSQSIFLRNGAAMIVMQKAQKLLTDHGFRD
ncbi:UNKNOWN [Stylonychia lemnae]|uniref:Mitochondrial carrier protein n=1 Tax=Stylonychia lemnae TaxID=5949 RepID=A0A078AIR2_STYLE|nr:UNKNOWN [Stylonychia lemnae]|eukprot:CDW82109.1 UNKNOWN [Stylonychia lemnae]